MSKEDIITLNLSGLGYREIGQAAELLLEYADNPPSFLGYGADGLSLAWNPHSDMMWLETEELVMGVLESQEGEEGKEDKKRIVQFFSCLQCGYEGTQATAHRDNKAIPQDEEKDFEKYKGYCSVKCAKENEVELDEEEEEEEEEEGETDHADDREVKRDFDRFQYE